jgi:hypothetical protein
MAGNIDPIYSRIGDTSANGTTTMPVHVVTATGDYTGASANHVLIHTAGSNGSFVQRIRCTAEGTNTASVLRIYLNNGSANTTAANNTLIGQISLPATTAINTAATVEIDYPLGFAIGAGFRIYVGVGTTVAAGWMCVCIAGQY